MGASPKGTVKLSDGREINVDVSSMTVKEWRMIWSPVNDEAQDILYAKLTGMKPEEFSDMLRDDHRRITQKIIDLSNRPLDNPNSPSASI